MTFCFPEEYCLDVNYKANDARDPKNFYHHCSFTWSFKIATRLWWSIWLSLPKSSYLSAVYLRLWLTGSEIIHMCWNSFTVERPTSFQNQTSHLKFRNKSFKKKYLLVWNAVITQNFHDYIYSYKKFQQKQLFL